MAAAYILQGALDRLAGLARLPPGVTPALHGWKFRQIVDALRTNTRYESIRSGLSLREERTIERSRRRDAAASTCERRVARTGSRACGAKAPTEAADADAPAVARYIADMTAQLESMATAAGLDLLAYFLAMARAESEAASHDGAGAASEDAPSG